MIEEDYVSFETAKLLKEKGFEGQCSVKQVCTERSHNEGSEWTTESEVTVDIPTIQMAMKWLREVHNIDISVTPDRKAGYSVLITKDKRLPFDTLDSYFIYEQACEAAIKYCIENLI